VLVSENHLNVRGWAYSRLPITRLEVAIDAIPYADARVGLPRHDVDRQAEWCTRRNVGFALSREVPALEGEHEIAYTAFSGPLPLGTKRERYQFA